MRSGYSARGCSKTYPHVRHLPPPLFRFREAGQETVRFLWLSTGAFVACKRYAQSGESGEHKWYHRRKHPVLTCYNRVAVCDNKIPHKGADSCPHNIDTVLQLINLPCGDSETATCFFLASIRFT